MQAKVFLHNVLIVLVALLAISLAWFSIDPYYGYAKAAATLVIVAFFLRFARDPRRFKLCAWGGPLWFFA